MVAPLAVLLSLKLVTEARAVTDRAGEAITVDAAYVNESVAPLAQKGDLSRFIL